MPCPGPVICFQSSFHLPDGPIRFSMVSVEFREIKVDMSSVRFAISYTVKDESRMLPAAIDYHIAAGCSRIYVFLDGTSDGSEVLLSTYPLVVARNSITRDEIVDAPQWMT